MFGELRNIAAFHVLLHVFGEKKRGHQVGSIFLERGNGRIIHQVTVFDGVHAGFGGPAHAFRTVGVGGHAATKAVGIGSDRFEFFEREL